MVQGINFIRFSQRASIIFSILTFKGIFTLFIPQVRQGTKIISLLHLFNEFKSSNYWSLEN